MNEQNGQKINIVNPLNPNEIIRTELLIQKQTFENNENAAGEEVVEPIEQTTKKKINPIIFIILVVALGLGVAGYFLITNYLNSNKEVKDPVDSPIIKVITLNDISSSFNNNIVNYMVVENSTITSSISDNTIIVDINVNNEITKYEFTLNERKLTSVLSNDDIVGYAITVYMFSAVSEYHGLNFNNVATYLNNNINDLSVVNNIEISELDQIKNISINIDEVMVIE